MEKEDIHFKLSRLFAPQSNVVIRTPRQTRVQKKQDNTRSGASTRAHLFRMHAKKERRELYHACTATSSGSLVKHHEMQRHLSAVFSNLFHISLRATTRLTRGPRVQRSLACNGPLTSYLGANGERFSHEHRAQLPNHGELNQRDPIRWTPPISQCCRIGRFISNVVSSTRQMVILPETDNATVHIWRIFF